MGLFDKFSSKRERRKSFSDALPQPQLENERRWLLGGVDRHLFLSAAAATRFPSSPLPETAATPASSTRSPSLPSLSAAAVYSAPHPPHPPAPPPRRSSSKLNVQVSRGHTVHVNHPQKQQQQQQQQFPSSSSVRQVPAPNVVSPLQQALFSSFEKSKKYESSHPPPLSPLPSKSLLYALESDLLKMAHFAWAFEPSTIRHGFIIGSDGFTASFVEEQQKQDQHPSSNSINNNNNPLHWISNLLLNGNQEVQEQQKQQQAPPCPDLVKQTQFLQSLVDTSTLVTKYPLYTDPHAIDRTFYYFEVRILKLNAQCSICIGLATKPYPIFRLVGWNKFSVGYYSFDGTVFMNSISGKATGLPFGENDIVGVGYKPESGSVFFTLNGILVSSHDNLNPHPYHAAVSSNGGPCTFQFNFGQSEFKYGPANTASSSLPLLTASKKSVQYYHKKHHHRHQSTSSTAYTPRHHDIQLQRNSPDGAHHHLDHHLHVPRLDSRLKSSRQKKPLPAIPSHVQSISDSLSSSSPLSNCLSNGSGGLVEAVFLPAASATVATTSTTTMAVDYTKCIGFSKSNGIKKRSKASRSFSNDTSCSSTSGTTADGDYSSWSTSATAAAAAAGGGGGYVIDRLVYPQIKIEDDDDDDDHYFDVRTPVAAAAPLPQLAPPLRTVSSFIPHQHQPHHHEDEGNSTIDEMYSIYYV